MDEEMIRILYIEDDDVDQIAFKRMIKKQEERFNLTIAGSIKEAKETLEQNEFDVIVSDFKLDDGTAFDVLKIDTDIPVIITTGAGDEKTAVEAMKSGATDYLVKDFERKYLKRIPTIIHRVLDKHKLMQEKGLAEEALRESEKQASTAIEAARGFTFNYNIATGKINWGGAIEEITGYTPEEFAEIDIEGWAERIHPDDRDDVLPILQEAMGKDRATAEYRFNTKKGYIILSSISLTIREDGKPVRLMGILQDITERKKMEEALKESEEKLRNIIENVNDWIWEVDAKGVYTFVSPQVKNILGYEPDEMIGKTPFDLMPEEEAKKISKAFNKIVSKKKPFSNLENTNVNKNGSLVVLETSGTPILDNKGNLLGYRGIDRDITERKKAEEALRESEERYRDLFENAHDLIQSVRSDGSFAYVNRAWKETLGYTDEDIKNMNVFEIVHQDHLEKCRNIFNLVFAGEDIYSIETAFVTKDGEDIILEGDISCRFEDGKAVATRGMFRDITARLKAEEELKGSFIELEKANRELRRADKMKDRFLSITSHELRNPLAGIIGMLELLREGLYKDEEELKEFLDTMHGTSKDMLETLNDLLDLQRIESGKMEPKIEETDVNGLLDDVYLLYARKLEVKGVELRIERKDIEDTRIRTDGKMVKQVLRNVVGNSVKFTDSGSISVSVKKKGDMMLFKVTDTGVGIDPKDIPLLFQPFSQVSRKTKNKVKGSGLGLAISKSLVEALGGTIRVESKGKNKGTKVSFTIPVRPSAESDSIKD